MYRTTLVKSWRRMAIRMISMTLSRASSSDITFRRDMILDTAICMIDLLPTRKSTICITLPYICCHVTQHHNGSLHVTSCLLYILLHHYRRYYRHLTDQSISSFTPKLPGRFDLLTLCDWHTVLAFYTFAENKYNIIHVFNKTPTTIETVKQRLSNAQNQGSDSTRLA